MIITVLLVTPFAKKQIQEYARKIWCYGLITFAGAKLKINGIKPDKKQLENTIIISNHISWLDTVVLLNLYFMRFIGKIEMLHWPFLRGIIKAGDTIFIDRKNKRTLLELNRQVADILKGGATIGLYPEGTSGDGTKIAPFKAPLLEAALIAKSQILPVVISYRKENNLLATEVTFKKTGWFRSIFKILHLKTLLIHVTILPLVQSQDFATRDELAKHLYNLVNETYISSLK
jgi:1-acyl-sn-glycerol-3-phosphate acyltransferase